MLDPNGRKEVIRAVRALNQVEKVTAILITHYMEEVIYADKVIVMDDGKIVMQGTPCEIFAQVDTSEKIPSGCATGDAAGTRTEKSRCWICRNVY